MKKILIYFFVALLSILLFGCSNDEALDEISPESTTQTIENVPAEEVEKNWLDYSAEEKAQNVEEKLSSLDYTDIPVEEVVENLDYMYESYDYSMVDFDNIIGDILGSMNQIELVDFIEQYGNDFFSEIPRTTIHHVIDIGNKVYVLHSKSSQDLESIKVSIAENGEWIQKDVSFSDIGGKAVEILNQSGKSMKGYDSPRSPYFYNNHLYYVVGSSSSNTNPHLLLDYQFSETGITGSIVAEKLPLVFYYLETNTGELAIMYKPQDENLGSTDTYEIAYVNDILNPIYTYERTFKFESLVQANSDGQYFNLNDGYLYVGDMRMYQLDTNTGEPIWDPNGQEPLAFPFSPEEDIFQFYDKGFFTIVDAETNSIGEYDADFNLLYESITLPISLEEGTQDPIFNQTNTETEIKIWQPATYQDKSYLEVVTLRKGYRPTPSS